MDEFFSKYSTEIFTLSGVLLGALIAGVINYAAITKETKLRLTEKLIDKKLLAHEQLLIIVSQIRTMVLLGGEDDEGELKRTPSIMESKENMDNFTLDFTVMQIKSDRWLSAKLKREMSLFLDYFVNLKELCRGAKDQNMQEAGVLIRNDFLDFSARLEELAHEYFNSDLMRLKYKTDQSWHKYPVETTHKKLDETILFQKKSKIYEILHNKEQP